MNEVPPSELAQTLAEPPAAAVGATEDPTRPLQTPPAPPLGLPNVEGYTVLAELGRGGMGVVYLARQEQLKRLVALKMILSGSLAGTEEVARFKREAESAARLSHPNIVQVYEVGEFNGLPFFSLEYVAGGSLADSLDGSPLPPRAAAELVQTLARAVHHAHQHGIIHRDLKPANILLANDECRITNDERMTNAEARKPREFLGSSFGIRHSFAIGHSTFVIPKVADFGLAKQLDQDSAQTRSGAIVGTPSYMAPEQARGESAIGTATDLYALGAILYELLAGRPPFRGATVMDTLEQVRLQEPVAPVRLQPGCPRDLETICLKCLRKEAEKRYGSAEALADELGRFLAGEPILARPVGAAERLWKWTRRRPAVAALAATTLLTALIGFGLVTWKWLEADAAQRRAVEALHAEAAQRQRAESALKESRLSQYFTNIAFAYQAWSVNDVGKARELFSACPADLRHWECYHGLRRCREELRTLRGGKGVNSIAFSADGKWLAAGGGEKFADRGRDVLVWDAARFAAPAILKGHTAAVTAVAFFPGGERLASASAHVDFLSFALKGQFKVRGEVIVWDRQSRAKVLTLPREYGNVAVSSDGSLLATAGVDGIVRLRNAASGTALWSSEKIAGVIGTLALSPDGRFLAVAASRLQAGGGMVAAEVRIWDVRERKLVSTLPVEKAEINSLAFSPDGKRLAWGGSGGRAEIWEVPGGRLLQTLRGHTGSVLGLAYSPDGQRLATSSGDRSVKVWNANSGEERFTLRGHTAEVLALAFDPAGGTPQRLATAGKDGAVKLWDADAGPGPRKLRGHENPLRHLQFGPDGRIVSCSGDHTVRLWDARAGKELWKAACDAERVALSPEGQLVAAASAGTGGPEQPGAVAILDARTGRELRRLRGHTRAALCVAFSPDGKTLASASGDPTRVPPQPGEVKLWEATSGVEVHSFRPPIGMVAGLTFSPDGRLLALAGMDGAVALWDVAARKQQRLLRGHRGRVFSIAFRPDGQHLASGDNTGAAIIWDVSTGRPLRTLRAHGNLVAALAYSPDGRRLASVGLDPLGSGDEIKLWDPDRGQDVLTLPGRVAVAFSPDGHLLAAPARGSLATAREIHVWDGTPENRRR